MTWDNGPWNAGLGIYHVGKTRTRRGDQGRLRESRSPSYIEPFFTAGRTVYRLVIDPVVSYNLSVGYRLDMANARFGDTRVRGSAWRTSPTSSRRSRPAATVSATTPR